MSVKNILKNKEIWFIILIGFFFRFYKIKENFSWHSEVSASLWPIIRLFEEKKLVLIGQNLLDLKAGIFRAPFFIYIFALPLKIFNFNPLVLEVIFAFIGLGVILLIYLSAKKLFNPSTAKISAFLYATSLSMVAIDKAVWTVTPMIIISVIILFLLIKVFKEPNKQSFYLFIIGCFVGLGFSFHFQILIILVALTLLFLKTLNLQRIIVFFCGVILLLSPLIIFNIRHNLIMVQGIKNTLFASQATTMLPNITILSKLNNSLLSFSDLLTTILNLPPLRLSLPANVFIFIPIFLFPPYFIYKQSRLKIQKIIISYFYLLILLAPLGLLVVNQQSYSTVFYLYFLIPILFICWSKFLLIVLKKYFPIGYIILFIILILITFNNFYLLIKQRRGNYENHLAVVDYILADSPQKKINIKFINREVIVYSYLFYYRAPLYKRTYGDLNLIEQWQEDKPDYVIIHGDYKWQENLNDASAFKEKISINNALILAK